MQRFSLIPRFASAFALAGLLALTACDDGAGFEGGDACARQGLRCPAGFVCNEVTGSCDCTDMEGACGTGSMCDTFSGQCICATDDCCPEGYRFDAETVSCACAGDDCCPPDHIYDAADNRCICTQDICCPDGFERDEAAGRCLCESDAACGDGFVCDQTTGDCMCQSDDVCDVGQFCNDFGFCQAQAACASSYDCPADQICDLAGGACISAQCVIDADCPVAHLCEDEVCVPGCHSVDDCWFSDACIGGYCRSDICDRDGQCGIGERCNGGACQRMDGPYCRSCDPQNPFDSCPGDAECVTQMVEGSEEPYCSPECQPDGSVPCPNGYACAGTYATGCEAGTFVCIFIGLSHCHQVEVHNEGTMHICGDAEGPKPFRYGCSPVFGSCDYQPADGETTRPALGEPCETMCQDGLVCANVGEGYRCYTSCDGSGTCPGGATCTPLPGDGPGACTS